MRKRRIALIVAVTLLTTIMLTACTGNITTKDNNTPDSQQTDTIGEVTPGATETSPPDGSVTPATKTPEDSPEPEKVRAIVFEETIDDPLIARMSGAPGVEGNVTLRLTLYETAPGVYTGDGMMERVTSMGGASEVVKNVSEIYYRLSFQDLKPGELGHGTTPVFNITDNTSVYGGDGDLGVWGIHVRSNQQMPTEYKLTLEGNTAQLYMKPSVENVGFEFEFTGSVTVATAEKPNLDRINGRCISVNSTYYETGKDYNHEYRAMLTAVPTSDLEYTGDLCVHGSAKDIPFAEEAVVFTLKPFNAGEYQSAGGRLPGSFDAFGVINTSGGKFIVLMDGERPLIEAANSGILFYGSLISESEVAKARHMADETEQLMRAFYANPDPTKAGMGKTPTAWHGKAPWYPDWLMPEPIEPGSWLWYEMLNALGFNRYRAQYAEGASIDEVFDNYSAQLSGYEGFEAYNPGGRDAVIYFTKGAYSVMITITVNTSTSSEIVVWIT